MHQPEGFIHPQNPSPICKHTNTVYGFRQALRTWYDILKN